MQGAKLRYVIKSVADTNMAVKFHRDVLSLQLKFESPGWSEFRDGRKPRRSAGPASRRWHLTLRARQLRKFLKFSGFHQGQSS